MQSSCFRADQAERSVLGSTSRRVPLGSRGVAQDSAGNLIGAGDMVAQSRQVFANIGRCLQAAGARPDQVTKITIFVANYTRDYLPMIEEGRVSLFGDHKPADTLVGVAALSRSGYMLEVDAIAVIEGGE